MWINNSKYQIEENGDFTYTIKPTGGMKTSVTLFLSDKIIVEDEALKQITDAASIDPESFVFATPDIHTGYGVPIGSVWVTPNFISPSAVGYDINCGMRLLSTPYRAEEVEIERIASRIAKLIPLGEGKKNLKLKPKEIKAILKEGLPATEELLIRYGLIGNAEELKLLSYDILHTEDTGSLKGNPEKIPPKAVERGIPQMGTLGGGNHFIEIQEVTDIYDKKAGEFLGLFKGQLTVMIHSGSRGLGHEVAGHYMKLAKKYMTKTGLVAPNAQLLYFHLHSKEGKDYLRAMNSAANYAFANREVMTFLIRRAFRETMGERTFYDVRSVYDVTHNIAKEETYHEKKYTVHRKGATRAFDMERMKGTPFESLGQPVLIPGSMGTASYVLLGHKTSIRSFYSVNHGAGRVLSRKQAAGKKGREALISDREFKRAMEGVYLICDDRRRIKEEAPQAYKDIDDVIEVVIGAKLALPVARMRPLGVLKG